MKNVGDMDQLNAKCEQYDQEIKSILDQIVNFTTDAAITIGGAEKPPHTLINTMTASQLMLAPYGC